MLMAQVAVITLLFSHLVSTNAVLWCPSGWCACYLRCCGRADVAVLCIYLLVIETIRRGLASVVTYSLQDPTHAVPKLIESLQLKFASVPHRPLARVAGAPSQTAVQNR